MKNFGECGILNIKECAGGDFMNVSFSELSPELFAGKGLPSAECSSDGSFMDFVEKALAEKSPVPEEYLQSGNVIVSPRLERKMKDDPELAGRILKEIKNFRGNSNNSREEILIINRNGESFHYSSKENDRPEHPTAEELKEVARARARKKARLDAYFHLLEKVCIKRKLIEQENAKRGRRYRCSVTKLDLIAESRRITEPPKNPDYYF